MRVENMITSGVISIDKFDEWQNIVLAKYPNKFPIMHDPEAAKFLVNYLNVKGFIIRPLVMINDEMVTTQKFVTTDLKEFTMDNNKWDWYLFKVQFVPNYFVLENNENLVMAPGKPKWLIEMA